jgi:hypothetical protein
MAKKDRTGQPFVLSAPPTIDEQLEAFGAQITPTAPPPPEVGQGIDPFAAVEPGLENDPFAPVMSGGGNFGGLSKTGKLFDDPTLQREFEDVALGRESLPASTVSAFDISGLSPEEKEQIGAGVKSEIFLADSRPITDEGVVERAAILGEAPLIGSEAEEAVAERKAGTPEQIMGFLREQVQKGAMSAKKFKELTGEAPLKVPEVAAADPIKFQSKAGKVVADLQELEKQGRGPGDPLYDAVRAELGGEGAAVTPTITGATGSPTAAPAPTAGAGVPLTKTNVTQAQQRVRDNESTLDLLDNLEASLADENVGFSGLIKRTLSGAVQQGDALAQLVGGEQLSIVDAIRSQGWDIDITKYDPGLSMFDAMKNMVAFKIAASVAGQSGRGLSDRDLKVVEKSLGLNDIMSNAADVQNKVNVFRNLIIQSDNVDRRNLGAPGRQATKVNPVIRAQTVTEIQSVMKQNPNFTREQIMKEVRERLKTKGFNIQ